MEDKARIGLYGLAAAALGGTGTFFLWRGGAGAPDGVKELLQVAAGVAGVLAGFLASSKSTLLAVQDRPALKDLVQQDDGPWSDLIRAIVRAIDLSIALWTVSGLSLLALGACKRPLLYVVATIWFALAGATTAAFRIVVGHIVWVMERR